MNGPAQWTLRQRVTALCVLVGLLLTLLAGSAAVAANHSRAHIDQVLNHAGPLRANAESLLTALVDQDAGVHGFALTGRQAELDQYEKGLARERSVTAEMDASLTDRPAVREQLRAVRQQAAQWRTAVALPVIAAVRTGGPPAGQRLISAPAAQSRFAELRRTVAQLQTSVLRVRDEVAVQARASSNTLLLLLVLAAGIVLTAGLILLILLDRLVSRPVTELAAQVREVAGGDYDRVISGVGPPELAGLARDVDGMRRQIVADLAEVRTARYKIEDAHRQLEEKAEELGRSNRDLEQFAYVASHDLQEPLRKVASFCQLLQRRYAGQLDDRADQYIAFAVDGAQRMQRLINDLLAFSRIGRVTAGFAEVDLNQMMTEVGGQLQAAQQAAGGTITWSDLPVVRGEEPLLTTLLLNLANNSLKFRKPGVPPQVRISGRRVDDEWEISCVDNGIGIEREFADKVFVIFQRLHAKDAYPGTGIGLAIAKKIVEYHGGRIWLDPDHLDGTAIRFTLPMGVEQQPAADEPAAQPTTGEQVDVSPSAATAATVPGETDPADTDPAKETVR
ncbi:MAG TPA: ATP-binding protein [Catenuloplanes sp.]